MLHRYLEWASSHERFEFSPSSLKRTREPLELDGATGGLPGLVAEQFRLGVVAFAQIDRLQAVSGGALDQMPDQNDARRVVRESKVVRGKSPMQDAGAAHAEVRRDDMIPCIERR